MQLLHATICNWLPLVWLQSKQNLNFLQLVAVQLPRKRVKDWTGPDFKTLGGGVVGHCCIIDAGGGVVVVRLEVMVMLLTEVVG